MRMYMHRMGISGRKVNALKKLATVWIKARRRWPRRRCLEDRSAMNLYWQSIKFLRPIYIDWFIHRIETVVNKCTVVPLLRLEYHRLRLNRQKRKEKEKKKKRKGRIEDGEGMGGREGGRKARKKGGGGKKRRNLESWTGLGGVVISVQIARG